MTQTKNFINQSFNAAAYIKPILIGAGFALFVITFFLLSDKNPDPSWGQYYMIKPLIIVPFAGGCGGAFYAFMDSIEKHGFWQKLTALFICIIVYIFGLWMGSVLGLNGTYWN